MTHDLERTLRDAIAVLDSLGLRYALVGGLAVSAWATPRATRDVDVYAELPETLDGLQRALEQSGFLVPAMSEELRQFGVFRSRSRDGVFLDIFDAVGPLGEAILEHRKRISLGDLELWLVAAEDLAVLKAFSDRPRDFDDLETIVVQCADAFDVDYLVSWARRLDESIGSDEVTERVRRALSAPDRRK